MPTKFAFSYYLDQFFLFLPKLVLALVVFGLGFIVARFIRKVVVQLLDKVNFSNLVKNTPLEAYFGSTKVLNKADSILGNIAYWLVLLFSLYLSASILNFVSLSHLIAQLFGYIPNLLTALVVLVIGVVLAGLVESMVKNMARSFDSSSAILMGKMASYLVVSLTILIVLSELGIAREFIIILFVGLVSAFSLAFGLAVGLGGQHVIKAILADWYQHRNQLNNQQSSSVINITVPKAEIEKALESKKKSKRKRAKI